MPGNLGGKVCIVTGAAKGIGAAIAQAFFDAGGRVLLTDIDSKALQQTATAISADTTRVQSITHNVSSESAWKDVVKLAVQAFGGIDVLVNNAGIHVSKPLADVTLDDYKRLLSVNLDGVFLGTREVVPFMKQRTASGSLTTSIINLSSVAGLVGTSNGNVYSMTKGGVRMFTKATAIEFGPFNIRINSIHPGLVDTEMGRKIMNIHIPDANDADELARRVGRGYPLQRVATPQDIANAAVFLASEKSSFMTGTEFVVDGGFVAR